MINSLDFFAFHTQPDERCEDADNTCINSWTFCLGQERLECPDGGCGRCASRCASSGGAPTLPRLLAHALFLLPLLPRLPLWAARRAAVDGESPNPPCAAGYTCQSGTPAGENPCKLERKSQDLQCWGYQDDYQVRRKGCTGADEVGFYCTLACTVPASGRNWWPTPIHLNPCSPPPNSLFLPFLNAQCLDWKHYCLDGYSVWCGKDQYCTGNVDEDEPVCTDNPPTSATCTQDDMACVDDRRAAECCGLLVACGCCSVITRCLPRLACCLLRQHFRLLGAWLLLLATRAPDPRTPRPPAAPLCFRTCCSQFCMKGHVFSCPNNFVCKGLPPFPCVERCSCDDDGARHCAACRLAAHGRPRKPSP